MNRLRRSRIAHWLILSLAIIALVVLPPLGAACACTSCGQAKVASDSCCAAVEPATTGCCCSAATCCSTTVKTDSCCTTAGSNCECTAVPDSREPAPLPSPKSAEKDVSTVTTLQADWQLPAVIPTLVDGCQDTAFGPLPRPVSVQIAFCVWRN